MIAKAISTILLTMTKSFRGLIIVKFHNLINRLIYQSFIELDSRIPNLGINQNTLLLAIIIRK